MLAAKSGMSMTHSTHYKPCELQSFLHQKPAHQLHHRLVLRLADCIVHLIWYVSCCAQTSNEHQHKQQKQNLH